MPSSHPFKLNRTYICLKNYAKEYFHVEGADEPQVLLMFQQDACLSERDFGIVAFRRNGSIQCEVVDDLYSIDRDGKEELRLGRQADVAMHLKHLGVKTLLNVDILLWNILAKVQDIPSRHAERLQCLTDQPARLIAQWIRNAIDNFETAIRIVGMPTDEEAFSDRSAFYVREYREGHYTNEYSIHVGGVRRTAECVFPEGMIATWAFCDERLVCWAGTDYGNQVVKFVKMDEDFSWIRDKDDEDGLEKDGGFAGEAVSPGAASFSGMAAYHLLDGKRYDILESSEECGKQYLKIRNEAGEEIWVDSSKAL